MISLASAVLRTVQLAAALSRLDQGDGMACIKVYSTDMPGSIGGHSDTPMCTAQLPKPCGTVTGYVLELAMADPALVMTSGIPRWAELVAADGQVLHMGDVTDTAHGGFWQVSGAATPEGETSPYFAAGGLLSLGTVVLT